MLKTVKFGGSSLADANQFRKCAAIVKSEESRRYVVVSAPGKRDSGDIKITDLLYLCYESAAHGLDFSKTFDAVRSRYNEIIRDLELDLSLDEALDQIASDLALYPNRDYAASRGEYLSAMIMSAYLGYPMIDTADCIFFDENGNFDGEKTQAVLSEILKNVPCAVFPGFYGSMPDGSVHTFSRGGSDVSGAIVARASASDLYENWTDVSGLLSCDPRIIENPQVIDLISYAELRELAYMGASVMHESAIFPVKAAGIPINIRNTNAPEDPGTRIESSAGYRADRPVTGIAGRKHFSTILIEKDQMNETMGFGMRVLEILYRYGVQMEHLPTGIDTMSVVVPTSQLNAHRSEVLSDLRERLHPNNITINDEMAMIAVVGRGMVRQRGTAGRVFNALGRARVNVSLIDQGSGELNIIIGVASEDFEIALNALYNEFFN